MIGGEKDYVGRVTETARGLWGEETVRGIISHIEATAGAVYRVGCYPLDPSLEPATRLMPGAG